MKGHVHKRGASWSYVVDAGKYPAQRCTACGRRRWADRGPVERCDCGGELDDIVLERRQLTKSGFDRRRDAEQAMRDHLRVVEAGGDPIPATITLREWAERWLASPAVAKLRPRTRARYRQVLTDHLLPPLGAMQLAAVRRRHVKAALEALEAGGSSPRSVAEARAILSSCMREAVEAELIEANPVAGIRLAKADRRQLHVPTTDQLVALLDAARGTTWELPLLIAANTGLRRSEVLGLTWRQVNLDTGRLRVVQGLHRVRDEDGSRLDFLEPKTDRSRREVSLPPLAVERLRQARREQAGRRLRVGPVWVDLDLVCERGDGGPLDPDSFSTGFKRLLSKAGLDPATRLHDVRHAVATTMLERNVHPAIASAVLGHASASFTMSTYQHVLDGMTDTAAAAIGEALGG